MRMLCVLCTCSKMLVQGSVSYSPAHKSPQTHKPPSLLSCSKRDLQEEEEARGAGREGRTTARRPVAA